MANLKNNYVNFDIILLFQWIISKHIFYVQGVPKKRHLRIFRRDWKKFSKTFFFTLNLVVYPRYLKKK